MPSSSMNPTTSDVSQQHHFYLEQIKVRFPLALSSLAFVVLMHSSLQGMADFKLTTLYVDYQHLMEARDILAKAITEQYYRYVYFLSGLGRVLGEPAPKTAG